MSRTAFILSIFLTGLLQAAPGDFDRTFAPGVVLTPLREDFPVSSMGVLNDGRSVVVGRHGPDFPFPTYTGFRYLADGTPEYGFGPQATDPLMQGDVSDFLTQTDGKLLMVWKLPGVSLARQNADGSLDSTFGGGGFLSLGDDEFETQNPSGRLYLGRSGDGKILVMGASAYTGMMMIRRLLPGGGVDAAFGTEGVLRHPILASSLVVQPDGKILVSGIYLPSVEHAMVRFMQDGAVDSGFSGDGVAGMGHWISGMMVQPDGKIVVTGDDGTSQVVSRWNVDGTLDSAFGTGGYAPSPFTGRSMAFEPVLAADGRLRVLGQHQTTGGTPAVHHHVVCYNMDGSLHLPYGVNGVALTSLQANQVDYSYEALCHATPLADGRLLVGAPHWNGIFSSFAIVRLNADGARDETYGGGLLRMISSGGTSYPHRSGLGRIALQLDGGILCPSVTSSISSPGHAEVHAFLPDGRPNTAFGTSGLLQMTGPIDSQLYGSAIVSRADGRFVLGGRNGTSQWSHSQRLSNGAADPAFNSGLVALTTIGTNSSASLAAMELDGSGRVVSCGHLLRSGPNQDFVLARHLVDGSLDTTFGQNGVVTTSVGVTDSAACMAILPDGKILVGGSSSASSSPISAVLIRFHPDGSPDSSFGTGGVLAGIGGLSARVSGLALLPDGRILAALGNSSVSASVGKPVLVRLFPDGGLDTTFGSGGMTNDFPAELYGNLRHVQLQKDGRIVAVGESPRSASGTDVLVLRFEPDGMLDATFGHSGRRVIPLSSGSNRGMTATIQPDNRILVSAAGAAENGSAQGILFQSLIRLEAGPLLANLTLNPPADRSASGVRLRGTVNPNGFATTALFEYGSTISYGQTVPLTLADPDGTVTEEVETLLSGLTAGSTYHYRLTATTAAGTRSTADGTFSTFSGLEIWRQLHFGNAANSGLAADTADFDLDGIPNLLEWACGLSPALTSHLETPVTFNAGVIEFTYTRDTAATGAIYRVEWSDTLPGTSWSTAGVSESITSQSGTIQTVKATLPAGTEGRRFVRLSVQGPL